MGARCHVDGTSFAAPIDSSIVAQMLEANPSLTPPAVRALLVGTASRLTSAARARQGYGVVDARRAVGAVRADAHAGMLGRARPPHVVGDSLVFVHHDDDAREVAVVGDFNGWHGAAGRFTRGEDGLWYASIPVPAHGTWRYKLLIDGSRWVDDPANPLKEPDPYGSFNTVIHVEG